MVKRRVQTDNIFFHGMANAHRRSWMSKVRIEWQLIEQKDRPR